MPIPQNVYIHLKVEV